MITGGVNILFAKISLDTPANLLESVLSRSSSWAVSSPRTSSACDESLLVTSSYGFDSPSRLANGDGLTLLFVWLVLESAFEAILTALFPSSVFVSAAIG